MNRFPIAASIAVLFLLAPASRGDSFSFSTGLPNGAMGMATRPGGGSKAEIEAADDFIMSTCSTSLTSASFYGLLPSSTPVTSITDVEVEIYRVFPLDSNSVTTGHVPTRVNSPSDVAFETRDAGGLTFTASVLSSSFTVANSVVNGINPIPTETTGGEGAVSGEEVRVDVTFTNPIVLPPGHYFIVPQVALSGSGDFLWLSGQRPTSPSFSPDLQSWIRNASLAPDWLRVGTDIVGGATPPTFNGAFSLSGTTVPIVVTPSSPAPLETYAQSPIATMTFMATGGVASYTFSATGALPPGLTLSASGELTGTPTATGTFPITVIATDAGGCTGSVAYSIVVNPMGAIPTATPGILGLLAIALGVVALRTLGR